MAGTSHRFWGSDNPTPFSHGGSSVLAINSGNNETWVDVQGAIHQQNIGVQNQFQGAVVVGVYPGAPALTGTGNLLQITGPNTAYAPLTLGGGHAGSLNVTITPTIAGAIGTVQRAGWVKHDQLCVRGHGFRRGFD